MGSTITNTQVSLLLLLISFLQILVCTSTAAISAAHVGADQAKALLKWKSTLQWSSSLSSWSLARSACCSWTGVACDAAGRVTGLTLPGAGLAGALAAFDFAELPALAGLNVSGNSLTGAIPASISYLTSLTSLDLAGNNLTGGIPPDLAMLPLLRVLVLRNNSLGGPIPESLGRLRMLERLDLKAAQLVSVLPLELGNLKSLTFLDLSMNNLSGGLPPSFAGMRNIREFYVSRNRLSGEMPDITERMTRSERRSVRCESVGKRERKAAAID